MGCSVKNKWNWKKNVFTSYILLWVFLSRVCYILILEIVVVHDISILLIIALTLKT
jgi:hypothetical protein